jgi:hypothetical protein
MSFSFSGSSTRETRWKGRLSLLVGTTRISSKSKRLSNVAVTSDRDVAKNFDVQGKTIIIYEDTILSEDQYYLNGFLDIYLLHTDPNYKPWSAKEVRTGVDILDAVLRHSYIGQKDATPLFTAKLLMPDVSVGGFKQVVYGPGILDIDELNDGKRVWTSC